MGQHKPPQLKVRQNRRPSPTPRLKAGVIRIVRPDGTYIGTGEQGILLNLPGSAAVTERLDGTRSRVDIAIDTGVSKERIEHMVNALEGANLVDRDFSPCAFTPAIAARMQPELDAIAHRPGVCDGGNELLQQRSERRITVASADRVGMLIATALSASGIGQVCVVDDDQVSPVDVIGGAVRMSDVGAERAEVAQQRIREALPVELPATARRPDLMILTRSPMPEHDAAWALSSTPHLVISCEPDGIVIGPLVLPGRSACTRCIALRKVDADPHWGVIEMARLHRRTIPSALAAHVAAAQATVHALAFIDTGRSAAIDATLHVSLDDGFVRPRQWSAHPLCGCHWS